MERQRKICLRARCGLPLRGPISSPVPTWPPYRSLRSDLGRAKAHLTRHIIFQNPFRDRGQKLITYWKFESHVGCHPRFRRPHRPRVVGSNAAPTGEREAARARTSGRAARAAIVTSLVMRVEPRSRSRGVRGTSLMRFAVRARVSVLGIVCSSVGPPLDR